MAMSIVAAANRFGAERSGARSRAEGDAVHEFVNRCAPDDIHSSAAHKLCEMYNRTRMYTRVPSAARTPSRIQSEYIIYVQPLIYINNVFMCEFLMLPF